MRIERIRINPEFNSAAIAVLHEKKTILLYRHNYNYYVIVTNFVKNKNAIFLIYFSSNAEKKDCLKKENLKNFLERFFNDYVDL